MDMKLTAASLRFRAGMGGDAAIYSVAGTVPNLNAGNLFDITSGNNRSDPDARQRKSVGRQMVIIAVIAALLFPALSSARKRALTKRS